MRSLTVRVDDDDVERVLDGLLPLVPRGVHRRRSGLRTELIAFGEGDELPDRDALTGLRSLFGDLREEEVPDEWSRRRLLVHEPLVVSGRLLVRPAWAPPADDLVEVVLASDEGFGTGVHPTTRACLARLIAMEPRASLADFGCGSGVLAIAALKLGWPRVTAVDVAPGSVAAARENAEASGVRLDAREVDLLADPPPEADVVLANVPLEVHAAIAADLARRPEILIVTGFTEQDADAVAAAYESAGLQVRDREQAREWTVLEHRAT